jgi:hypothetical protein
MTYTVTYRKKRIVTEGVLFWDRVLQIANLFGVERVEDEKGKDLTGDLRREIVAELPF